MTAKSNLDRFKNQLALQLSQRASAPEFKTLDATVWIAMSLLQKAIRRGDEHHALAAAATLLTLEPARFWRRCGCIAFEDIGVADLECLGLVTAGLAGKAARRALGGEWEVASLLVSRMTNAPKNRAADDLLMVIDAHLALQTERTKFASCSEDRLREIILGCPDVLKQGLALWYLIGTDRRPSQKLPKRRGTPKAGFEALAERGVAPTTLAIIREGFQKTGEMLAPFVGLLSVHSDVRGVKVEEDQLPAQCLIGDVPSYAIDGYTREGRAAYAKFLKSEAGAAEWIRSNLPGDNQVEFLAQLVFRVEGGALANRCGGQTANWLRRQYELECLGICPQQAERAIRLMARDMPILNDVRETVMGVR